MPIIKLLRGGQLTLPAEVRKEAQLTDGDLLEVSCAKGTIMIKPIVAMSSDEARKRIGALLTKSQRAAAASGMSEEAITKLVEEEIAAVRAEQRKTKTRV